MGLGIGVGIEIGRGGGSAPAFNPVSLSPTAWYDPSDLSTLFQDNAGTTPVTASGQPVGKMLDKSGNGNHVFQATAAARPIYTVATGLSFLQFDGVDDELVSAALGSALVQPNSMAIAVKLDLLASAKGAYQYLMGGVGGNRHGVFTSSFSDLLIFEAPTQVSTGQTPGIATPYVFNALMSGASSVMRLSGVASAAVNAGTGTLSQISLGSGDGSNHLFGKIYGAIIGDTPFTAPQNTQVETYLGAKAGLSL